MRTLWGTLCVVGVALPYSVFIPWVLEHGLDLGLPHYLYLGEGQHAVAVGSN